MRDVPKCLGDQFFLLRPQIGLQTTQIDDYCSVSMPITREEFEKGEAVPGVSNSILHFLIENPGKAFSLEELENGMLSKVDKNTISAMAIDEALGRLVRLGLVENRRFKKSDKGYTIYYILKTPPRPS